MAGAPEKDRALVEAQLRWAEEQAKNTKMSPWAEEMWLRRLDREGRTFKDGEGI